MPITAPLANAETEPARVRRRKRNRRASPYKSIDVDQFYCYRRRATAQGGCAFPARLEAISRDSQGQRLQGLWAVTRAAARDVQPPLSSPSNQRQSMPTVPSTLPIPAPSKRFSQRWQPGCSVPGGTPSGVFGASTSLIIAAASFVGLAVCGLLLSSMRQFRTSRSAARMTILPSFRWSTPPGRLQIATRGVVPVRRTPLF